MKQRHLMAAGWHVVSIPYFEWELYKSAPEKLRYLTNKLKMVDKLFDENHY